MSESIWAELDGPPPYAHWREDGLDLHYAARTNDLDLLRRLLADADADLEQQRPPWVGTPLHIAVRYGYTEAIQLLLQHGARLDTLAPHYRGSSQESVLVVAARWGQVAAAKMLLDAGVCTHPEGNHTTALAVAVNENRPDMVSTLLAWSDAWTEQDKISALQDAAECRNADTVKILLGRITYTTETLKNCLNGALGTYYSNTPGRMRPRCSDIMLAHQERIVTLLRQAGEGREDGPIEPDMYSFELQARQPGGAAGLRTLLESETTVSFLSSLEGREILSYALLFGCDEDSALLLVEKGVFLWATDPDNELPIHKAASRGYLTLVQRLIAHGANPLSQVPDGRSAIHFAAVNGQREIVAYLIAQGVDVDERSHDGLTPLMMASASITKDSVLDTVAFLLDAGAEINAATSSGCTALVSAVDRVNPYVTTFLLSRGADVNCRFRVSPEGMGPRIGYGRLIYLPHVTTNGLADHTPLHWAVYLGLVDQAALLLQHGADPNARDGLGSTPLLRTVNRSNCSRVAEKIFTLLLDAGADPDIANNDGVTFRDRASTWPFPYNCETRAYDLQSEFQLRYSRPIQPEPWEYMRSLERKGGENGPICPF